MKRCPRILIGECIQEIFSCNPCVVATVTFRYNAV